MNDQIKEIAKRLFGLRDSLDKSVEEMSKLCDVSKESYEKYESGNYDIPMSFIQAVSRKTEVEMSDILFGQSPKVNGYYITRSGDGVAMERTKAYKYQALSEGFAHRKVDPFIVTVDPKPEETPITLNSHDGQEFNYIICGKMLLSINGKEIQLNQGDSIYFDANLKHGMKALEGEKVKFLAFIL